MINMYIEAAQSINGFSVLPGLLSKVKCLQWCSPYQWSHCPFWHLLKSQELNQEPSVSWWWFRTETWQLRYLLPFKHWISIGTNNNSISGVPLLPSLTQDFKRLPVDFFFLLHTNLFTCCASNLFLAIAGYAGVFWKLPSVSEEFSRFTMQRGKDSLTTQQPAPTQLLVHSLPGPQSTTGMAYRSQKFPEDQLIQPGGPRY